MNTAYVLKNALLSEKAYAQMEQGIYTFWVDTRASKDTVKKAVEKQFAVSVTKVNITKSASKSKRIANTRKMTKVGGGKKAIVWLASGQNISMLLPKTEAKKTKEAKVPKETKASETSNEQKEAKKGLFARLSKSKSKNEKEVVK